MYFRSTITGTCVKADILPRFGGWELITEEEYKAWCEAHNIR